MNKNQEIFEILCPDIPGVSVNELSQSQSEIFEKRLIPLRMNGPVLNEELNIKIAKWLRGARDLFPNLNDWTGIYYKASFALGEDSTDLVLGPFIGAPTDHTRIPLDKGLCGLALKEEKTINIGDVKSNELYLACSVETQAEIVIPLMDKDGNFIAELDIDAHTKNAFGESEELILKKYCQSFADLFA